jgi:hypothetical protein
MATVGDLLASRTRERSERAAWSAIADRKQADWLEYRMWVFEQVHTFTGLDKADIVDHAVDAFDGMKFADDKSQGKWWL